MNTLKQTLGSEYFDKIRWEDIIPDGADDVEIKSILKELNSQSKFFSRITVNESSYGKNIQWASEINKISEIASCYISSNDMLDSDFHSVIDMIAEKYQDIEVTKSLAGGVKPEHDRRLILGLMRTTEMGSAHTAYSPSGNGYGANGYSERFKNNRTSPYPDVQLTQCKPSTTPGYGKMLHPSASTIEPGLKHIEEKYEELRPLVEKVKNGGILTDSERKLVDEDIAEMYFLMANIMPWNRGSNGISDIFMRSMYKSLNIDQPALKKNLSLDLEAFCMDMDEYKEKWNTFFE